MFEHLNENSRVWIYQSDRIFKDEEILFLNSELKTFVAQWAAHGSQLFGDHLVFQKRFIILCVDESQSNASGCSIDSSVRVIKALGKELSVDFFSRMNVYIEKDGLIKYVHISEVKENKGWKIFNPMITNLKELRENWFIPVELSPFA